MNFWDICTGVTEEQLPSEELPMDTSRDVFYFTDGALAYAGHHYHDELNPVHSHSFVEIAFVIAGSATHLSLGGRQRLRASASGQLLLQW
jgi:hypothetical protein